MMSSMRVEPFFKQSAIRTQLFLIVINSWLRSLGVVNHDVYGGTAPDALVWDNGSILGRRFSSMRVIIDLASLPGPLDFWDSSWFRMPFTFI